MTRVNVKRLKEVKKRKEEAESRKNQKKNLEADSNYY